MIKTRSQKTSYTFYKIKSMYMELKIKRSKRIQIKQLPRKHKQLYKEHIVTILSRLWKISFIKTLLSNNPKHIFSLLEKDYNDEQAIKELFSYLPQHRDLTHILSGMKKQKRALYTTIFANLEYTCYSNEQLIELIIEYSFGRYKPLTSKHTKYFFNENPENEWIESPQNRKIMFINSSFDYKQVQGNIRTLFKNSAANETYFHATNWKGALDILKHGPIYTMGRKCLDFGISPSFYVGPSLNEVFYWGQKKSEMFSHEIAIIIFQISKPLHSQFVYKHFETPDKEWQQITTISRQCEEVKNYLDDFDFVYGPMVANPQAVVKKEFMALSHKVPKLQLASKSKASDMFLKDQIVGVIWISKSL